jgi:RimJ/RimL family protein N-acetyltransferase
MKNRYTGMPVYAKVIPGLGTMEIRRMNMGQDIPVIYDWVKMEYAKYWGMNHKTIEEVRTEYEGIIASPHANAYMGMFNDKDAFLCECYNPEEDAVGKHYEVLPGDAGMHVLVGPPEKHIHQFTWYVFMTIMDFMFSDSQVNRVVVEPDINNEKIHDLNKRAGFEYHKTITLPHKTAGLAFCTRAQYHTALAKENNQIYIH